MLGGKRFRIRIGGEAAPAASALGAGATTFPDANAPSRDVFGRLDGVLGEGRPIGR